MSTTLTPGVSIAGSPGYGPDAAGTGLLTATTQTARRTILQFIRTPQLLVMGAMQGALFLLVFHYIFGGAIDTAPLDYVDFLVPGFLVTNVLWLGMAASAGFVAGCALLLVVAATFSWMFVWLGLIAGNAQAAQGMSLITLPLTFVSSGYVPADSLPGWMQPFANNQPITVLSNAVRSLMLGGTDAVGIGHTTGYWVTLSLAWCAGIGTLFAILGIARFGRRR